MSTAPTSPGGDDAAGAARALLPGDGTHEDAGAAGRDLLEVVEVLDAIAVGAEEADVHIEGGRVAGIEADGVDTDADGIASLQQPVGCLDAEPREVEVRKRRPAQELGRVSCLRRPA